MGVPGHVIYTSLCVWEALGWEAGPVGVTYSILFVHGTSGSSMIRLLRVWEPWAAQILIILRHRPGPLQNASSRETSSHGWQEGSGPDI